MFRSSATIAARGVTVLMIEHVMQAVMSLCAHVYRVGGGAASSPKARRRR